MNADFQHDTTFDNLEVTKRSPKFVPKKASLLPEMKKKSPPKPFEMSG